MLTLRRGEGERRGTRERGAMVRSCPGSRAGLAAQSRVRGAVSQRESRRNAALAGGPRSPQAGERWWVSHQGGSGRGPARQPGTGSARYEPEEAGSEPRSPPGGRPRRSGPVRFSRSGAPRPPRPGCPRRGHRALGNTSRRSKPGPTLVDSAPSPCAFPCLPAAEPCSFPKRSSLTLV